MRRTTSPILSESYLKSYHVMGQALWQLFGGASLSLMDAGVPIKSAVAGIAMGLIKEEKFHHTQRHTR